MIERESEVQRLRQEQERGREELAAMREELAAMHVRQATDATELARMHARHATDATELAEIRDELARMQQRHHEHMLQRLASVTETHKTERARLEQRAAVLQVPFFF